MVTKRLLFTKNRRRRYYLRRILWFFLILALLAAVVWWLNLAFFINQYSGTKQVVISTGLATSTPTAAPAVTSPTPTSTLTPTPTLTPAPLPASLTLPIPFLVQAPFGQWDALHEDACEETSLIMVYHYLQGTKWANLAAADQEIKEMVAYEDAHSYGKSITLDQLAAVAQAYYPALGIGRVEKNITVNDLKRELAAGRPVIIGAAGKVLPNPFFKNGGPNYHMLVVRGFDEKGFITNDPGVRQGENFRYTYEALYGSIHDWDAKNILNGGKDYLVFD